ncbi:hypothetical protein TNCV_135231 [Trichonephila clavipes]|nr:hypothetical protein TNCV_135231 [Trichonephila clavipes]
MQDVLQSFMHHAQQCMFRRVSCTMLSNAGCFVEFYAPCSQACPVFGQFPDGYKSPLNVFSVLATSSTTVELTLFLSLPDRT